MNNKMTWHEAAAYMRAFNKEHGVTSKGSSVPPVCTMIAVISADSFDKEYTLEERSYRFSNREKAFLPNMGGYSIFACSLDGSDHARLEQCLKDEGVKDGWTVEYVYIEKEEY